MTVPVLFARSDNIYYSLNCDVYDKARNALNYSDTRAPICHPPCRAFCRLRSFAKPEPNEKDLAYFAVDTIQKNGGVLEHPQSSILWKEKGLPLDAYDAFGGFTLTVDQFWFGHKARKRTWLYIVGLQRNELPTMPMQLGIPPYVVGLYSGRDKSNCRPSIQKKEREATPIEFAKWLIEIVLLIESKKQSFGRGSLK